MNAHPVRPWRSLVNIFNNMPIIEFDHTFIKDSRQMKTNNRVSPNKAGT